MVSVMEAGVHDLLTKLKPLYSYVKCNVNRVAFS